MPDNVCAYFKDLGDYDYRPPREVAEGAEDTEVRSVIDVDILGHIFEQSITDLERLRLSLQAGAVPPDASATPPQQEERAGGRMPPFAEGRATILPLLRGEGRGEGELVPVDETQARKRRKQEGAVYTPAFITRYIAGQALGGVLKQRFGALRRQHESEASGTARKSLADPKCVPADCLLALRRIDSRPV